MRGASEFGGNREGGFGYSNLPPNYVGRNYSNPNPPHTNFPTPNPNTNPHPFYNEGSGGGGDFGFVNYSSSTSEYEVRWFYWGRIGFWSKIYFLRKSFRFIFFRAGG